MSWPRRCLWQRKPKAMRVSVDGKLGDGVTAKDVILAIIARIGTAGAVGHVIEYAGSAIRGLSIEGRLTVCNMSIEAGGKAGMVAPDDTTIAYLEGRPFAPKGAEWDKAVAFWRTRAERRGRRLRPRRQPRRRRHRADGDLGHQPRRTRCRSPARIPEPSTAPDAAKQDSMKRALDYMGLVPGTPLERGGGRPRLHRLLHQQPHRGPARRGQGRRGPQGRDPGLGGRGLGPGEEAGRGRGAGQDLPRRRLRMARARLLDVRRHERRHRQAAASASPRPRTATSSAGRGPACARISSARRWRRPPP